MRGTGAFRAAGFGLAAVFLFMAPQARAFHAVDTSRDGKVSLGELLRAIQFHNSAGGYHCAAGTEDGYAPGPGERDCAFHDSDYTPADWAVSLSEVLRAIQFYNSGGYVADAGTEDGFGPGIPTLVRPDEALLRFDELSAGADDFLTPEEAAPELGTPEAFGAADVDNDGLISRFEFLAKGGKAGAGNVVDSGGPSITLNGPDVVTLACGESFTDPGATASDPDEGDISRYITVTKPQIDPRVPGIVHEVTYKVSDLACNNATATRTVIVEDTVPPEISLWLGPRRTIECGDFYYPANSFSAKDTCNGNLTRSWDIGDLDTRTPGDYTVIYRATDASGNQAEATQTILVRDYSAPQISLIGDVFPVVPMGTPWEDPGANATDACEGPVAVQASGEVDTSAPGTYTVTYSAADSTGRTRTAQRTVRVYDPSGPDFSVEIALDDSYQEDAELILETAPNVIEEGRHYYAPGTTVTARLNCFYNDYYEEPYAAAIYANGAYLDYVYCGEQFSFRLLSDIVLTYSVDYYYICKSAGIDCGSEGEWEGSEGEGEGEGEGETPTDGAYENPFRFTSEFPRSNFSIDVDTASYALMRRYLQSYSDLPPGTEVRIEEFLNYFDYAYPRPAGDAPFKLYNDLIVCPWKNEHQLLRVAIQAPEFMGGERPAANIVMLLDVSGSMSSRDKLPLLKSAMAQVVQDVLGPADRVAIVTYASGVDTPLASTPCTTAGKAAILAAINALDAGGATNGSGGLQAAYAIAKANLLPGKINRVLLGSDGDFNVGITSQPELTALVKQELASGVSLTTLGFGIGNLRDSLMESLAANGNGNYHYLDTIQEAVKVLVQEARSTFETIARDVKVRVEFDPARVYQYRLLGYENRGLSDEEFEDDTVDAGELGLGDSVTALYEIVPVPGKSLAGDVIAILDVRYKPLDCGRSRLLTSTVGGVVRDPAPKDALFAAGIAEFGMLLRGSRYKGGSTYGFARSLVEAGLGYDPFGHRAELVQLIDRAAQLDTP